MTMMVKKFLKSGKIETILEFLIKFNLLAIPLYAAIFYGIEFLPLQKMTAFLSYILLQSMGYNVELQGTVLTFNGSQFSSNILIDTDCTAWKSMYALAALMIASPAMNDRKKLVYILIGMSAVYASNILRIVSTICIADALGPQYMDIIHTLLWREAMIFVVIIVWYTWLKRQKIISDKNETMFKKLYN